MNRHEQLQDRYEDALFALLMDEIAATEGEKAEEENRLLQNDPAFAVPEEADRRCRQTIRRHFTKQQAYTAGCFTWKAMKRLTMAAGLAAILFTGAFAASETVRTKTLNLVVEVFDTNTYFLFDSNSPETNFQLKLSWIPAGFYLKDQGEYPDGVWYEYQRAETESIYINSSKTDGLGVGVDTESAGIEHIEINGNLATLIDKNGELHLAWAAENNSIYTDLIGIGIDQEDLLHVANEIIFP